MAVNELAKMSTSSSSAVRVRSSPSGDGAFFFWAVSSDDVGASSEARGAVEEASEAAAALLVVTMGREPLADVCGKDGLDARELLPFSALTSLTVKSIFRSADAVQRRSKM